MEMLDVSPHVHFLNSMRSRNLGWEKALAEIVDNAFDAGANRVKIASRNRLVEITDDGKGVSDLSATVASGKHNPSESTELGMFGVGLKDAWHWAGTRMEVRTVHNGNLGVLVADSSEIIKSGRWAIPAPTYSPSTEASGTTIRLHLANTAPKRNAPAENHFKKLAWMFSPALQEGKQILVPSGKFLIPLKAIVLPPFIDFVEESFTVEGKHVEIRIGIVSESAPACNGMPIWVQYGHRNITKTNLGCGSYTTDRIRGIVKLKKGKSDESWQLTANKDDLTDFKDELNEAIGIRIRWMLEKAEQLMQDVANDMIKSELETQINEAIAKAKKQEKERRPGERGQSIGAIARIGTGKKRRRATVSDPNEEGSVEKQGEGKTRLKRGICIAFGTYETQDTVGEYDSLSSRVTLNKTHPFIAEAKQRKNHTALHAIAFGLICNWQVTHAGDQKLMFSSDCFEECYGRVLAALHTEGGVPNAKAAI
jgi:hypothetical protein